MKKSHRSLIIPSLLAICLTSCTKVSQPIYAYQVLSKESARLFKINVATLTSLVQADEDFFFYASDPNCSSCSSFSPTLLDYIAETGKVVFNIDGSSALAAVRNIQNARGERIFSQYGNLEPLQYTPTLCMVKNGNRVYDLPRDRYFDRSAFFATMPNYSLDTQIFLVQDLVALEEIINDETIPFILALYDNSDLVAFNSYLRILKDQSIATGLPVYLWDNNLAIDTEDSTLAAGYLPNTIRWRLNSDNEIRTIAMDDPNFVSDFNNLVGTYFTQP